MPTKDALGYLSDKHQKALNDQADADNVLVAANVTQVATNKTDIATNVTNIATNVTDIATNVTDIATNATAITNLLLSLESQKTQLSSAQVNALLGANIEVIAAPAAGLARVPVFVHMFLDHGGTDFVQVSDTDQLALKYNGGAEIAELGTQAQCTTFLEASADAALDSPVPAIAGGVVPVAATAIDLDNNGAAELTTGDGTLSIEVFYRTVTMAAFS